MGYCTTCRHYFSLSSPSSSEVTSISFDIGSSVFVLVLVCCLSPRPCWMCGSIGLAVWTMCVVCGSKLCLWHCCLSVEMLFLICIVQQYCGIFLFKSVFFKIVCSFVSVWFVCQLMVFVFWCESVEFCIVCVFESLGCAWRLYKYFHASILPLSLLLSLTVFFLLFVSFPSRCFLLELDLPVLQMKIPSKKMAHIPVYTVGFHSTPKSHGHKSQVYK